MKVKGLTLGDTHFGIPETKRLYNELHQFIDYLNEHKDINLIVFTGDYFDCKLSVGDLSMFYAMSFFKQLMDIVKSRKIIFRMIQGTRSHDLNQLQIFKPYQYDKDVNFRIIETAETEELLGMKILYVPEEYPENSAEFYSKFKSTEYDAVFSHTTFDFVALPGQIENSLKESYSAPVFIWSEWKKEFKNGFVISGHIHGRNTYLKKIFYPGSFTSWNFKERSKKGFCYFESDPETKEYEVKYIDNIETPEFNLISVKDLDIDLSTTPVQDIKVLLESKMDDSNFWKIDLSGLNSESADTLKKCFQESSRIKTEYHNEETVLKESESKKDFAKWHYITKRELPINKMIQKYLKEELHTDMTLQTIDKILKED